MRLLMLRTVAAWLDLASVQADRFSRRLAAHARLVRALARNSEALGRLTEEYRSYTAGRWGLS